MPLGAQIDFRRKFGTPLVDRRQLGIGLCLRFLDRRTQPLRLVQQALNSGGNRPRDGWRLRQRDRVGRAADKLPQARHGNIVL